MFKIAAIYGAIAGTIIIAVMSAGIYMNSGSHGEGSGSQVFGYLVMIVTLSLIFVGIKRYRDRDLGGVIKFAPAFGLGVAIAAIAGVFYVIGWEIYLAATDYAFARDYAEGIIAAKQAAGVSGEALEKVTASMNGFVEMYKNPVIRLPMTFIEIFPVGLIVALVSALLLRNPKLLPAR